MVLRSPAERGGGGLREGGPPRFLPPAATPNDSRPVCTFMVKPTTIGAFPPRPGCRMGKNRQRPDGVLDETAGAGGGNRRAKAGFGLRGHRVFQTQMRRLVGAPSLPGMSQAQIFDQSPDTFIRISLQQVACFRVGLLKKIGHKNRSDVFRGTELLAYLEETFSHEPMA